LSAHIFGDEFFPRDFCHCCDDTLIPDAAGLELLLDHILPLGRELGTRGGLLVASGRNYHSDNKPMPESPHHYLFALDH
jgi:hypothetical protein